MEYYIVDVFAENKYEGNQLAVFLGDKVGQLSAEEMQNIAKEINYSETTFITSVVEQWGGYNVRIFTPKKELPFAGHPTLGTAYIIQDRIIKKPIEQVILNLEVGQIPVKFNYVNETVDILWMQQQSPLFAEKFDPQDLAEILSLEIDDIDQRFPIQSVSTGVPFIIVPLKNHAALKKAQVNLDKLWPFIADKTAKEILIFCPETYHQINDLSVRVFADNLGIPEDPATGSANGCLAGYLAEYQYFGKDKIDLRIEQGYEIDRPSLLLLRSKKQHDQIIVNVGGNVIMIAQGNFF